jgi:hypothetical protein
MDAGILLRTPYIPTLYLHCWIGHGIDALTATKTTQQVFFFQAPGFEIEVCEIALQLDINTPTQASRAPKSRPS